MKKAEAGRVVGKDLSLSDKYLAGRLAKRIVRGKYRSVDEAIEDVGVGHLGAEYVAQFRELTQELVYLIVLVEGGSNTVH